MLLAVVALTVSGCGGGGTGDTLPINGVGGTIGGSAVSQLQPAVVEPPQESFVNYAGPTDTPATGWVKNMYIPLPSINGSTGAYQNASTKLWADEIFNMVNAERANRGLKPLKRNRHLDAVAQAHSRDMALRNFFAHANPEGMNFLQRLQAVEGPLFDHLAENAAKGQESTTEVVSQWVASPGHAKNMLNSTYEYAGVGVYYDPSDKKMPMHITMDFVQFLEDPATYSGWTEPGDNL